MHCCDTGKVPAVRLEHLTVKDTKKLNRVVGAIKNVFRGDANIMLMFSGGKISKIKFLETTIPLPDEE